MSLSTMANAPQDPRNREALKTALEYLGVIAGSLLAVWALYDLWGVSLRLPIAPLDKDGLNTQATVFKSAIDNTGLFENVYLGAPFGSDLRDLPLGDWAIWTAVKCGALFTSNHILLRNVIVIGSFPLTAAISLYVMRRLGIGYLVALGASLLFSFSSFHHLRSSYHPFLAVGHFTVPLVTLLCVELFENRPLFVTSGECWYRPRTYYDKDTRTALVWCVLIGITGSLYFPAFAIGLLGVAAVVAASRHGSVLALYRGLCSVAIVIASLALSLAPTVWNRWNNGAVAAIARGPGDAERYGLKLAQLVIPSGGHRIDFLRRLGEYYGAESVLINENVSAYLGLVAICGLTFLLATGLWTRNRPERLQILLVLALATILYSTVGGLSSLVSFLLDPTLRSVNRISVHLHFFALLTLAILAERWRPSLTRTRARAVAIYTAYCAVIALGLYDQCPVNPDYGKLQSDYLKDDDFVTKLERLVPKGSSIFEYPYSSSFEAPPSHQLTEYEQLRPYLHSKSLRWSYGAFKGRRGDSWYAKVAAQEPQRAVATLALAGFSGIYVARRGFVDSASQLEGALTSLLGAPKLVSSAGDISFYTLDTIDRSLRASLKDDDYRRASQETLTPPYVELLDGFSGFSTIVAPPQRCAKGTARFLLGNPGTVSRKAQLNAIVVVRHPPATVRLASDVLVKEIQVDRSGYVLSERLELSPGRHFVELITSEPPEAPHDFGSQEAVCLINIDLGTVSVP